MAIFVNVPRTTTAESTATDLHDATVGHWPLRTPAQIVDVIAEIGDAIYGVRANTIVSAYPIKAVTVTEGGRFVITAGPNPDPAQTALIGATLPAGLAWQQGEQWPVKLHDSAILTTD